MFQFIKNWWDGLTKSKVFAIVEKAVLFVAGITSDQWKTVIKLIEDAESTNLEGIKKFESVCEDVAKLIPGWEGVALQMLVQFAFYVCLRKGTVQSGHPVGIVRSSV